VGEGQKRDGRRRRSRRRGGRGPNESAAPQTAEAGSFNGEGQDSESTWPADPVAESLAVLPASDVPAALSEDATPSLDSASSLAPAVHEAADAPQADAESSSAASAPQQSEAEASSPSQKSLATNEPPAQTVNPDRPKKTGWWQRAKASIGG
jgi:ribonuclease E